MAARVVYLGNAPWSVPPLEALADHPDLEVVLVLTRTPRPGAAAPAPSRRRSPTAARARGLPLAEVASVREGEGRDRLLEARPDVLAVVAYGELLPPEVLDVAPLGAVNLHLSLLPRWRGASPVQHALLAGDRETGVTAMLMDEGLDTGPILEQEATAIGERRGRGRARRPAAPSSADRSSPGRSPASRPARRSRAAGRRRWRRPRRSSPPTTARIRWDEPAGTVLGRVRAFAPSPAPTPGATAAG